jgi:hypothetical protein
VRGVGLYGARQFFDPETQHVVDPRGVSTARAERDYVGNPNERLRAMMLDHRYLGRCFELVYSIQQQDDASRVS